MKVKKLLSLIWNDSVFSTIISNIIWALPAILIALSPYITTLGNILKIKISIYFIMILLSVLLLIITLLLSKLQNIKKELYNQNCKLIEFENKQKELDSIQNNKRFEMFKIGDVVKMKTAPISNCMKYTVIGKNINGITLVDMNNNELNCHPEALMTSDEYIKENNEWCERTEKARRMTIGKWI